MNVSMIPSMQCTGRTVLFLIFFFYIRTVDWVMTQSKRSSRSILMHEFVALHQFCQFHYYSSSLLLSIALNNKYKFTWVCFRFVISRIEVMIVIGWSPMVQKERDIQRTAITDSYLDQSKQQDSMNNGSNSKGQFLPNCRSSIAHSYKTIYSNLIHCDLIHSSAYLFEWK